LKKPASSLKAGAGKNKLVLVKIKTYKNANIQKDRPFGGTAMGSFTCFSYNQVKCYFEKTCIEFKSWCW